MDTGQQGGRQYELDHLATFTVTNKHGLLHPEDGIRKLKLMDSSTGIWTMRCTMVINPDCVFIVDKQSGETMEQFPIELIVDPMAVSSRGSNDMYSNILLFTVLEDPKKISSPTEMHIFQCCNYAAEVVADDLKRLKNNNRSGGTSPQHTYQPPSSRQSESNYVKGQVTSLNAMASTDNPRLLANNPRLDRQTSRENGSLPDEMTSEKIDRDVTILNHCFDDIEKFVGRLQLVAGARKELDRRKKSRGKKSKKNHGDGLLIMRARPPPKEEFIDCFKKFKLAFNLLARLRPYIHDPNSGELVHFLMTPLSLVVGASKDPVNEMPDVVLRIVSPLLTFEGKELLQHCLRSKEHDFWVSLGEAWTLSREQWNSFVPPYYPKFSDGWEPYTPGVDGEARAGIEGAVATRAALVRRQEETTRAKYEAEEHVMPYPRSDGRDFSDTVYRDQQQRQANENHVDIEYTSSNHVLPRHDAGPDPKVAGYQAYVEKHIDRNRQVQEEAKRRSQDGPNDPQQGQFLAELKQRGIKVFQVTHERVGRNIKELSVSKHEYLEVLDNSRNWWKMRNQQGSEGYVPFTILKQHQYDVTNMNGINGGAAHYTGSHHGGATNNHHNGGAANYPGAHHGGATNNYISTQNGVSANYAGAQNGGVEYPPTPPAPPAPVPPPVLPVSQMRPAANRSAPYKKAESPKRAPQPSVKDELHDELKRRMSIGTKDGQNLLRPVSKYINLESTSVDVRDWLMSKGFSQRILQMTNSYNGNDLFSLTRQEISQICHDREEGNHLESQITVQKNISGFDTFGASELNAILHDRKRRADLANLGQPPPFIPAPPRSESSDSSGDIPVYGNYYRR